MTRDIVGLYTSNEDAPALRVDVVRVSDEEGEIVVLTMQDGEDRLIEMTLEPDELDDLIALLQAARG